ncbi:hypothetical protein [Bacillus sp. REN10]|uniref:hypothetical protein n=1 Tax=Bacillus sp. REN10 TaxID=2782541 RepID=UPI00193BAC2E|nr:hypothetical protein [Bacillus sp. REN10]
MNRKNSLIAVLVLTNIISLIFVVYFYREKQFIHDPDNARIMQIAGSNGEWEVVGGNIFLDPTKYLVTSGGVEYIGNQSIDIKSIEKRMFIIRKDGTEDSLHTSAAEVEETISKGYKTGTGSVGESLDKEWYEKRLKESGNGQLVVEITYETMKGKRVTSKIITLPYELVPYD